ncbi:MAG: hypothetical protein IPP47_14565 [Bryobacterales bacterium]|nr:hypothetical protein [Bryobacterales bacterium]
MRIKRLTQGSVMCERLDCGKPATLALFDAPPGQESACSWMVAYCDEHAGRAAYEAMMDAPPAAERQGPGRKGSERKRTAVAS